MGTILTSYGDAGYDHEGYAAQVLDDGTLTGTHSAETAARMVGQVVAACACGWAGATRYPTREEFDEHAEALALTEWEHTHARPVLAQAQHADLARLRALLRDLPTGLDAVARSPQQLARTVTALESATDLARGLQHQAVDQLEQEGGSP